MQLEVGLYGIDYLTRSKCNHTGFESNSCLFSKWIASTSHLLRNIRESMLLNLWVISTGSLAVPLLGRILLEWLGLHLVESVISLLLVGLVSGVGWLVVPGLVEIAAAVVALVVVIVVVVIALVVSLVVVLLVALVVVVLLVLGVAIELLVVLGLLLLVVGGVVLLICRGLLGVVLAGVEALGLGLGLILE